MQAQQCCNSGRCADRTALWVPYACQAVLLNELAPTLGSDLCKQVCYACGGLCSSARLPRAHLLGRAPQFVVPEVVSLSEDPAFRVRKATALNMNNICATAGPDVANKRLIPAFIRLSEDDIWGVRKAVAESLVSMSRAVDEQTRVEALIPICLRFVGEMSRWVRIATFQHLGPFISTIPADKVLHLRR